MKIFERNGKILAKLITEDDWKPGLGFFSEPSEFIQVGTWLYNQGKDLTDHFHQRFNRIAERTCEVVYMVNGRMKVRLYTLSKELVEIFEIKKGDTLILLDSGHGYEILDSGTKVLEVKNGPFMGVDIDKVKF